VPECITSGESRNTYGQSLLTHVHDFVTSRLDYCNFVPCIASGPDRRIDIGPKFSKTTPALYFRIAAFQQ